MRRNSISFGLLIGTLLACGGGGSSTNPPPVQKLGSITVSPTSINLTAGNTTGLTVQALDETGGVIISASGYSFSSATPTVAEVTASGTLVAISAGASEITVSLTRDGVTKTASTTVNVHGTLPANTSLTAGANITFSPSVVVIPKDGTVTFSFGAVTHSVNFDSQTGAPANIGSSSITSVERTFTAAGNFSFQCGIHPSMTGQVLVR